MNAVNSYTTSKNIRRPSVTAESRLPCEERSHDKNSPSGLARRSSMQPQRAGAASASAYHTNSVHISQSSSTHGQQYNNSGRGNRNNSSNQTVLTTSSSMSQNGIASSASREERVWKSAVDPKTGRTYYYDVVTRETQWRKVSPSLSCKTIHLFFRQQIF
jgi:hypothetical protein